MNIATIFLNGKGTLESLTYLDYDIANSDLFCADGGAEFAKEAGLIPKLIIGDLDSLSKATRDFYSDKCEFEIFPANKNKTDGELIMEKVAKLNYDKVFILFATGGRLDQTILNLTFLERYKNAVIVTSTTSIFPVFDHSTIYDKVGSEFSLVPISDFVEIKNLSGFKFNLNSVRIPRGSSLTSSNLICEKRAEINIEKGFALAFVNHL